MVPSPTRLSPTRLCENHSPLSPSSTRSGEGTSPGTCAQSAQRSKVFPGRRVNCCGFARARAVGPSDQLLPFRFQVGNIREDIGKRFDWRQRRYLVGWTGWTNNRTRSSGFRGGLDVRLSVGGRLLVGHLNHRRGIGPQQRGSSKSAQQPNEDSSRRKESASGHRHLQPRGEVNSPTLLGLPASQGYALRPPTRLLRA